ncbi:MAG: hypothetical protein NZ866_02910 [Patescibacteria group bacterium]|nr:hypothetical protein [Patescibacteria group bacterium]
MIANIFFFSTLFFILGIFFNYYFSFWILFGILTLIFFRYPTLILIFLLSFLVGGFYLDLYQKFSSDLADEKIKILKEFSSTNYYHKYLGSFKREEYFIYLPYYYERLNPYDKLLANFEKIENRIFIRELIKVEKSIYTPIYQFRYIVNNIIDKNYSLTTSEIIGGILYGREINEKKFKRKFERFRSFPYYSDVWL